MWEFVVPDDEAPKESNENSGGHAEYRPQRMGLGASKEMIQEKISENAKKTRLAKLLKRQDYTDDALDTKSTSSKLKRSRLDDDSDGEMSKASLIVKKATRNTPTETVPASDLSKSQRKRMKQKLKAQQKMLLES